MDGYILFASWVAALLTWRFAPKDHYPDDKIPSLERQIEIVQAVLDNRFNERYPYENVVIKTRGELSWVFAQEGWSGDNDAFPRPQMRGVILRDANLDYMQLVGVDFRNADLHRASLYRANLIGANLARAELSEACCQAILGCSALFMGAHLRATNFREASLEKAFFSATICDGTDFTNAQFNETRFDFAIFVNVDFSTWQQEHIIDAKLLPPRQSLRCDAA